MTQQFRQHELTFHDAQMRFRKSNARYRGFVGGRGSGKSYALAADTLMRASQPKYKGRLFYIIAPTYQMLRDSSLRTFEQLGQQLGLIAEMRKGDNISAVLVNGAEVLFRSGDEPERLRGPNISGAALEEASLMQRSVFDIVIAALREGGEPGWLSAAFTPKGKLHWTYEVFGRGLANVELFHSKSGDNPFLPPDFVETIKRQYTSAQAAQELGGEFTDLEGTLFRRDWFPIVEYPPNVVAKVRAWDLAATKVKDGNDPDWTAGVLMGRLPNATYVILDVVRARTTPQHVEELMHATATRDGPEVAVFAEEEPGSAGKFAISHLLRNVFAGLCSFMGVKSTGEKATRAAPLAAQAEAGNVRLLRGAWNKLFLDEIETFPAGGHDDQVDAASLAFSKVAVKFASVPDPKMLEDIQRDMDRQKRLGRRHYSSNLEPCGDGNDDLREIGIDVEPQRRGSLWRRFRQSHNPW